MSTLHVAELPLDDLAQTLRGHPVAEAERARTVGLLSDHQTTVAILTAAADQRQSAIAHAAAVLRQGFETTGEGIAAARATVAIAEMVVNAMAKERADVLRRLEAVMVQLRRGDLQGYLGADILLGAVIKSLELPR